MFLYIYLYINNLVETVGPVNLWKRGLDATVKKGYEVEEKSGACSKTGLVDEKNFSTAISTAGKRTAAVNKGTKPI